MDSKIEYFHKDELCSEITINDENVSVTNFTEDVVLTAFGVNNNPSFEDLKDFLENRCFPRGRANCKEILKYLGVDYYDPFQICYVTHGVIQGDYFWMRWEDQQDVNWNDTIQSMYVD